MNITPIEWTDFSANPLKYRDKDGNVVWACVHESPGCKHCYSEALAKRYGRGGPFNIQTTDAVTPFLDENELHKMRTAKVIGGKTVSGSKCFIGDMTDIFGPWVSDDLLNHLFSETLELRTDVTWQILTKRAERMQRYLSWRWGGGRIPSRHIHIGVSIENQKYADERIPLLLQTPAAIRFISAEPLLGAVDLRLDYRAETANMMSPKVRELLHWVIVGGESGNGARPMHVDWIRSIVKQCRDAKVAVFVKQLGAKPQDTGPRSGCQPGVMLDEYNVRVQLKDKKGGDINEFPTSLQVREFPTVTA